MSVLPDRWIREVARVHGVITPYAEGRPRKGKISYGISSYGYDFRLADEYKIPDLGVSKCWDPKKMDEVRFRDHKGPHCIVPGNSFVLGRSLEYFRIPRDVIVVCLGKSTYARCGIIVNVTPLEPEWEGYLTLCLVNAGSIPVKVYSGEGIAQMILLRAASRCEKSYADRKGKYQAQKKIEISKV